jgi:hypothetical protein
MKTAKKEASRKIRALGSRHQKKKTLPSEGTHRNGKQHKGGETHQETTANISLPPIRILFR